MRVKSLLFVLCVFVACSAMSAPLREPTEKAKKELSFEPLSFKTPVPTPPKEEGGMGPSMRSTDATHPSAIVIDSGMIATVISFVNNNDHTPPVDRGSGPGLYYNSILFGAIISPNAP